MRNPTHTAFAAVYQNELLLNSKRIAPYALMVFFSSNAILWSVAGTAAHYGWATNSDFYIARNFGGFAFGILGLPLFAAVIMADPVIRDFRLGVDALIFSKPVSRSAYLFGKFLASFSVLVCCQAAFALTLVVLQVVHTSTMVVLPFRILPYFKHFLFLVVISYLLFAAVYFTVGTLTRNAKTVYGLALAYYPLYIALQLVLLKNLPAHWRIVLDPLLMNSPKEQPWGRPAAWVDQIAVNYSSGMIANRALVILAAAICLAILYFRFSITERATKDAPLSVLALTLPADRIHFDQETTDLSTDKHFPAPGSRKQAACAGIQLPEVFRANEGLGPNLRKLVAATKLELRLIRSEKSLVVIVPLTIVLSFLSLPFSGAVSDVSYSASFASHTANGMTLFLLGVIVFYTGEAMHRDREAGIEPVIWSLPAPNNVLLLSKFLPTLLLALLLLVLVGLTAMLTQLLRGQGPVEIFPYLITYTVILVPSLIFMSGASLALNILLRDKYLTYAFSIAAGSGLFYVYTLGYNHWLYNPVLYGLWNERDLVVSGGSFSRLLLLRVYCLTLVGACLFLGLSRFTRKV